MEINGYELREQIRKAKLKVNALFAEFESSVRIFEGEKRRTLTAVTDDLKAALQYLSKLEAAQEYYNLASSVVVRGGHFTLAEAVKQLGGISRLGKVWNVLVIPKKDRYGSSVASIRSTDAEYAIEQFTREAAIAQIDDLAGFVEQLRSQIATANSNKINITLLD
jgi:hypothetical protein